MLLMDVKEVAIYMAYDLANPPDDPYWRSGMLASVIEGVFSTGRHKIDPEKFIPRKKRINKQSNEQLRKIVGSILGNRSHKNRDECRSQGT